MKFILVRHAHTFFNQIGLTQGWCDSPLTKKGIEETQELESYLRNTHVDVLYSSPTGRAHETAKILNENRQLEIKLDERLKEVNFGTTEGMPTSQRNLLHIEDYAWPYTFKMDYRPYEGEDLNDVIDREINLLNECISTYKDDTTIMMVGHGCSLYGLMRKLIGKQLIEEYPTLMFIANSSAVTIEYHDGCYKLIEMKGALIK